jgi:arylsulfatase
VNGVKQKPIEGVSMVYSFDDPKAMSTRRIQYFEMMGNPGAVQGWLDRNRAPRAAALGDDGRNHGELQP